MINLNGSAKPILETYYLVSVFVIVVAIVLVHWFMRARTLESVVARTPAAAVSLVWALLAFAIVIAQGSGSAFIYFQF
jgi:alginate O-acetyltransferase complex protein AlgI